MDSNKKFIEIPETISGLFHSYHDTNLADDSLSDIDVILACIYLIENKNKKTGVEYNELKKLFVSLGRKEDNFRKIVSLAKKNKFISGDIHLSFLIGGLKKIRTALGQIGKTSVFLIKSGENFTAIKLFEEFLAANVKDKEIDICDSHISSATLFPFSILNGKISSFKILTANIYDSDKLKNYIKRMSKEMGLTVEVRANNKIHDRFMISGDKCWSIGCSIKDFGNKDTTIKEISEVLLSMKDLFKER